MKKFLALLLAALMVLSMVACGSNEPAATEAAPAATDAAVETPTTAEKRENKLIYGSTTELTGDFTSGLVENGASDMMVSDLLNDYGTMVTNQFGEYVDNTSVMESWERTDNEDGTATYTIKIKEGLVYNNGEPITAKDYTVRTMLGCSNAGTSLGVTSASSSMIVGGEAYYNGEVDFVSGLRIIDEYTVSVSIVADYANYYYADTYAALAPWSAPFWFGEGWDVADNGEGTSFTFNGEACQLDADAVRDHFNSSKNGSRGEFVSAGPYTLVEFDQASSQATLKINPNYVGNFEGQKPSIETLVIVRAEDATWADAMKTGAIDLYESITDGDDINTVLDMIDSGAELQYVQFDRAGYGKLQFFCDVTPTQFIEVRHAIAMLLDRVAFADTFCAGWGGVVDGPYAPCLYQYQANKDRLADNLNTYAYDVDGAIATLVEGGWTLNAEGGEYTDGIRYKEVTAEQALYMDECVTLADGRILMPLIIKWCSSEGNAVSDLLASVLANGDQVKQAGMQINQDVVDFNTLLNAIYRTDDAGAPVDPYYSMTNLATGFTSAIYDYSFYWTDDPKYVAQGYNSCYLFDMGEGGMDDLSMRMVYDESVMGNEEAYLDLWAQYIERWNEMLPEVPLYSNIYITALPTWVEGYEQNALWSFQSAVLYASIPSAQ